MFDSKIATHRSELAVARRERRWSSRNAAYTAARRAYNRAVRHDERGVVARLVADHDAGIAQDLREEVHALRHAAWRVRMAEAEACLVEVRAEHFGAHARLLAALESAAPRSHVRDLGEKLDELSDELVELERYTYRLEDDEPVL